MFSCLRVFGAATFSSACFWSPAWFLARVKLSGTPMNIRRRQAFLASHYSMDYEKPPTCVRTTGPGQISSKLTTKIWKAKESIWTISQSKLERILLKNKSLKNLSNKRDRKQGTSNCFRSRYFLFYWTKSCCTSFSIWKEPGFGFCYLLGETSWIITAKFPVGHWEKAVRTAAAGRWVIEKWSEKPPRHRTFFTDEYSGEQQEK